MRIARALALAACIVSVACRGERESGDRVRFPGDTTGVVRPQALVDLESVVRHLNAIVVARVRDISTSYDRCEGPRTVLHLGEVRTMLGAAHTDTMQLRVFGGPVPGGRYIRDSKAPRYVPGGVYALFLFNTDWRYSPVIADHAFRVDTAAGREILITPNGHAVTGVSPLTVEATTRRLYLPQGVPGVGNIAVLPTRQVDLTRCGVNPDGTPRCPPVPVDTAPARETFTPATPWTPRPPTKEDVANTITLSELVRMIDSVATRFGVTPGGYFARRSRLECWNATPTRGVN